MRNEFPGHPIDSMENKGNLASNFFVDYLCWLRDLDEVSFFQSSLLQIRTLQHNQTFSRTYQIVRVSPGGLYQIVEVFPGGLYGCKGCTTGSLSEWLDLYNDYCN